MAFSISPSHSLVLLQITLAFILAPLYCAEKTPSFLTFKPLNLSHFIIQKIEENTNVLSSINFIDKNREYLILVDTVFIEYQN